LGFLALAEEPIQNVVRFGLFTDLHAHDIDSPSEGKWMTHTEQRIGAFVEAMNGLRPDFVVELGDFINGWVVFGADPGTPDRIPTVLAWADGLYAGFDGPRYHVIGNHDLYNLDKAQYLEALGTEATYYSFDVGAFHFVVLDVQYQDDGTDLSHTYTGVSGYVPPAELDWLERDLSESGRPTLVFTHQMIDAFIEEWGRPLIANQADVQRILTGAGNVIAVFQGHDHAYRHAVLDGIHYVTFEALVDRDTPASWALVTLDGVSSTLTIDGTGDQPSAVFTFPAGD
jgi:alkaline phosphatase